MKATLTFDLPDDQEQFTVASQATDWVLAMWDLDQWLRGKLKCCHATDSGYDGALKEAHDRLYEILQERNLDLEVLP